MATTSVAQDQSHITDVLDREDRIGELLTKTQGIVDLLTQAGHSNVPMPAKTVAATAWLLDGMVSEISELVRA
jgi:hypothetical protein